MSHSLCDRCDQVSGCCLNYDGKPCQKLRSVEPNNYDRIRDMDVEEMSDMFSRIAGCPLNVMDNCPEGRQPDDSCNVRACWLIWLNTERKRKKVKT